MTLVVDTSALLCRYLVDGRQPHVDRLMAAASDVVVTALARAELTMALDLVLGRSMNSDTGGRIGSRIAADWDRFWVLPIDRSVVGRAAGLGGRYGLNLANALHLSAIERLPLPATLLTYDDRQVAPAYDLGLEIEIEPSMPTTAHGLLVPQELSRRDATPTEVSDPR